MDGLGIDRQREDCLGIIQRNNWVLFDEYVDQSISATDRRVKRPAYQRMLKDYEAGYIDGIVAWDLDRLTRQPRELEDIIDMAQNRGLVVTTANGEADLRTDGGRLYARLKAGVALSEMERKSARQSRAHKQRAKLGVAPKGPRPLGYHTDGSVVENEAAVVRGLYLAVLKGTSLRTLTQVLDGTRDDVRVRDTDDSGRPVALHALPVMSVIRAIEINERRAEEGLPPKPVPEPKSGWLPSTLHGILRNPRYVGYSVYTDRTEKGRRDLGKRGPHNRTYWRERIVRDDKGQPVMGQWEPIVDESLWWMVQEKLNDPGRRTNRTGSTRRTHMGTSLYRCGECGDTVRSHGNRYRCINACLVRARGQIDDYVDEVVRSRLSEPDYVREFIAATAPADTENTDVREAITAERGRVARAEADYDDGIIEGRDLKRIRDKAEERIATLEKQMLSAASAVTVSPILLARSPEEAWVNADIDAKRQVIDALMTVTLHRGVHGNRAFNPDTVEITWRV